MIHFGILGAGNIAHRFMQGIQLCEKAQVEIVYTRHLEKGQAFIEKYGIKQASDQIDDLLNSNVDAIYVATPHQCHASDVMKCLKAKKHVLCEKPIFIDLKEAKEGLNVAKENQLLVMEAMKVCFLPTTLYAKKWIREGKLGKIQTMKATFCRKAPFISPSSYLWDSQAGGALFDVGCYPMAFMNFMMEEKPQIQEVKKEMLQGVDASTSFKMAYSSLVAELACSFVYDLDNKAEIIGEKGSIVIPNFWKAHEILFFGEENEKIVFENIPEFKYQIDHFCSCIENHQKESPLLSHDFMLMNLECLLEGRK